MSVPRFLVPSIPDQGDIELPDAESHHACRVLRLAVDDKAQLFDGQGNLANGHFSIVTKRTAVVSIENKSFAPLDHDGRLHFAVALPKGDRQRSTIEKLVELGVDSLTPITSQRSVAVLDDSNIERLHRYSIEASKQCGRNRLMRIHSSFPIEELRWDSGTSAWILHPYHVNCIPLSLIEAHDWCQKHPTPKQLFLIGPEGGFVETEVETTLEQGAKVLSLGPRIQRVETAVSSAAVLGSLWLSSQYKVAVT
jgi:16S rRNA (uracil1498-N3)-methyltransferase